MRQLIRCCKLAALAVQAAYDAYQFGRTTYRIGRAAHSGMSALAMRRENARQRVAARVAARRAAAPYMGGGPPAGFSYSYIPRGPSRRRLGMLSGSNFYKYVRSTTSTKFSVSLLTSNLTNPFGYAITLADLPNVSEFTSLYDQFKITYVKWHFLCTNAAPGLDGAGGVAFNGWMHTAIDTSDITPEAVDTLRQHSTYKVCRINDLNGRKGTVGYQPKVNLTVANPIPGNALGQSQNRMWLDTATATNVEHHGLKLNFTFPTGLAATTIDIEIYAQIYVTFKNPK